MNDVPPTPRRPAERRPPGFKIRGDLDDALREYCRREGVTKTAAVDVALEYWLTAVGALKRPG